MRHEEVKQEFENLVIYDTSLAKGSAAAACPGRLRTLLFTILL
ncbi:hypothetical protein HMP0721_2348 [Pseudoramibacter alactolyticus ATCC 23263]|uniref:Uncharacterized protein n=1 Tax=Pseudoramibacter alactolyticus ATCC 23263 TaxID=887929 RepID=E6MK13_9FIRM|nr:hypothetical protein HMP0721_2348 [Pseudoramibacter alactolyticus ATCC 23263]